MTASERRGALHTRARNWRLTARAVSADSHETPIEVLRRFRNGLTRCHDTGGLEGITTSEVLDLAIKLEEEEGVVCNRGS